MLYPTAIIKSNSPDSANCVKAFFASVDGSFGSYSLKVIPNSFCAFSNPLKVASLNDLSPLPPVEYTTATAFLEFVASADVLPSFTCSPVAGLFPQATTNINAKITLKIVTIFFIFSSYKILYFFHT